MDLIENRLKKRTQGKVAVIGIGNILRGDDGFGPELASRLKGKITAECVDAGSSPENHIGKIIKSSPDTIVFLDALSMNEKPGAVRLLEKDMISNVGFTTHDMPASLIIDYIRSQIDADVFMVGVQAKNIGFNEGMSEEIKTRIDELERLFKKILGRTKNEKV